MKRFYVFVATAAMLFGAASCKKSSVEQDLEKVVKEKVVFAASSQQSGVKTSLGAGDVVNWSENDQVKVFTASTA